METDCVNLGYDGMVSMRTAQERTDLISIENQVTGLGFVAIGASLTSSNTIDWFDGSTSTIGVSGSQGSGTYAEIFFHWAVMLLQLF